MPGHIHGLIICDPSPLTMQIAIGAKTVAVLGCKTESQASQPAFFVAQYLQSVGINLIPVPGQHGPQTCS